MLEGYQLFEVCESWWYLLDGCMLRVIVNLYLQGGVIYIYENVIEQLDLESCYNVLVWV